METVDTVYGLLSKSMLLQLRSSYDLRDLLRCIEEFDQL